MTRDRKGQWTRAGMVTLFTCGGKGKVFKCTIDRFCRTRVFRLSDIALSSEVPRRAHVVYQTECFRASIVHDPRAFLSKSEFSPHYIKNCALRKGVEEALSNLGKLDNPDQAPLFVVMEEYKEITPTAMDRGECIVVDQAYLRGGTKGEDAILALHSSDGVWPDESADIISENIILAVIKAERDIPYDPEPLIDCVNFLESKGRIVYIQEAYTSGRLTVGRPKLSAKEFQGKMNRISEGICRLRLNVRRYPVMSELVIALKLEGSKNNYLCLWYLRLWEAAKRAGARIGDAQFRNPGYGGDPDRHSRRTEQKDHRRDLAHGRSSTIDPKILNSLQKDVFRLLRENVLG